MFKKICSARTALGLSLLAIASAMAVASPCSSLGRMRAIAVTFFTGSQESQYKDTVVFPPKEKAPAIFLTYTRCE